MKTKTDGKRERCMEKEKDVQREKYELTER